MKTEAWLILRHNSRKFEVVPSPLTDDTFLDEGDEAHALVRLEDAEAAIQAAVAAERRGILMVLDANPDVTASEIAELMRRINANDIARGAA